MIPSLVELASRILGKYFLSIESLRYIPDEFVEKIFNGYLQTKASVSILNEQDLTRIVKILTDYHGDLFCTSFCYYTNNHLNFLTANFYFHLFKCVHTNLTELDFSHVLDKYSYEEKERFLNIIGQMETIEYLRLTYNQLNDEDIRLLTASHRIQSKALCNLHSLHLQGNHLTNRSARFLKSLTTLDTLYISLLSLYDKSQFIKEFENLYECTCSVQKSWEEIINRGWIANISQLQFSTTSIDNSFYRKRRRIDNDDTIVLIKLVRFYKINMYLVKSSSLCRLNQSKHLFRRTFFNQTYINGQWVSSQTGETFKVYNPSTGEELGSVPNCNNQDAEKAIQAAYDTFNNKWSIKTGKERSVILRKFNDLILKNKNHLGKILTAEMGKPLKEAVGEIVYGASYIEWFAEEAKRIHGDVLPVAVANRRSFVIRQPVGVCGFITPWNFPSSMILRKAGPALAAGCTIVIKPAEDTPYSCLALCDLAKEAGFPDGAINVLTSTRSAEIGKYLCEHPLISKMSFTGSTEVGKKIMAMCASTVKKISLELGGNAPFLIFNSADIKQAVQGAMASKFRASGQTCVCANRILVQDGIYDEFVAEFTKKVKEQNVGDGLDDKTQLGPVINKDQYERVIDFIDDARKQGATIVTGGNEKKGKNSGFFVQPIVVTDVKLSMRVAKEEIFGPVAALIKFKTEDEAVKIANSVDVGLAAYLYSQDLSQVWRVAERLQTGMVGINEGIISSVEAPFGGIKQSGFGREGSKYGIDDYVNMKYLCMGGLKDVDRSSQ
ncbi:hypothetical protein I4U23_030588 [Adineta vaga]|nr:hypothetical protein I4U23_030588 [Adineta vaga]